MKYQSSINKKIFFEEVKDTPISYLKNLDLSAVIQLGGSRYLFFEGWKINKRRKSHVGYYAEVGPGPFRSMEEHIAYGTIWKYLVSKKYARGYAKNPSTVFRLWGTPYITEMNTSGIFTDFEEDVENRVFQLMIITDNDTIEIVNPNRLKWVKCNPKKFKDVIINLTKKFDL